MLIQISTEQVIVLRDGVNAGDIQSQAGTDIVVHIVAHIMG